MKEIIYFLRPELERPALIMGFDGWPNAGQVSTGAMNYLESRLGARPLASLAAENYFNFTEERPTAVIENGQVLEINHPKFTFTYVLGRRGDRDLVLFSGPEPHLCWYKFTKQVLELVKTINVEVIYTLGGTYDYVPHWLPAQVSAVYSEAAARDLLPGMEGLGKGHYHGPISIHTVIMMEAAKQGIPVVGLWGHSPVYIQTGNIKVHLFLIEILKKAAGFTLDTSDLASGIKKMDRQIEELVADNPKLKQYLDEINQAYSDSSGGKTGHSRRPTKSKKETGKIIPFEEFLRKDDE